MILYNVVQCKRDVFSYFKFYISSCSSQTTSPRASLISSVVVKVDVPAVFAAGEHFVKCLQSPKRIMSTPHVPPSTWAIVVQWALSRGFHVSSWEFMKQIPRHLHPKNSEKHLNVNRLESLIGDLRHLLFNIWPNMKYDGDYNAAIILWLHEWRVHGIYTGLSVKEYFQKVYDLYKLIPDHKARQVKFGSTPTKNQE